MHLFAVIKVQAVDCKGRAIEAHEPFLGLRASRIAQWEEFSLISAFDRLELIFVGFFCDSLDL